MTTRFKEGEKVKAIRISAFSDSVDNLNVEKTPDVPLSSGEVKVSIMAACINPSDVKNLQGMMEGTTLPRIPGRDFAGVVVEDPSNLLGLEVWGTGGDVGFTRDGSHAEFMTLPVEAVLPKPRNLTFEQAACAGVSFATAYQGLIRCAKLQSGETLLVTGARGGVGSAVLKLGQALNAKLIAVDRKPFDAGVFEGVKLFAHVDTSQSKLVDAVRQITSAAGVDVVFDCVGGELFEPALSTVAQLGRYVAITSVGVRRVSFDLLNFYHRRLTLFGVDSRALTVTDCAKLLAAITPLFEAGSLRPSRILRRGSLGDARELYAFVASGGDGKAVFVTDNMGTGGG
ncbi:MAG TPA: zinc-binding alcohol dehydrogenase family protein [Candidatus Bathyarchaeia archaeon]|nr:zinc-binding alcohol dehydrogenase family protein [Candidatus Bathyarchaeia archaeon]